VTAAGQAAKSFNPVWLARPIQPTDERNTGDCSTTTKSEVGIMSLSFYYEFTAPATTPAEELEAFLREVEHEAKSLGFKPTVVLNVPFDTP
jgi:hypothetical protein